MQYEEDGVWATAATWQPAFRWGIDLLVDGVRVGALDSVAMLIGMAPFSGIDVGVHRGGPVSWELHQRHGTFPFTGTLHAVSYTPGQRADYDPAVVAESERDVAMAFD